MNELDPNSFDVDVDLENGTATVTGIESEIKARCQRNALVSRTKKRTDFRRLQQFVLPMRLPQIPTVMLLKLQDVRSL